MSVKPQIFQETKQSILRNKHQFIQIQLKQANKRISKLNDENQQIKKQIKQLKIKNAKNVINQKDKLLTTRRQIKSTNKQNLCSNKNQSSESHTHRINIVSLVMNKKKEEEKLDINSLNKQITQYEEQLMEKQRIKQQKLRQLENKIKFLKQEWTYNQQSHDNQRSYISNRQMSFQSQAQKTFVQNNKFIFKNQVQQTQMKKINKKVQTKQLLQISIDSLNQNKIDSNSNHKVSLNNSINSQFLNSSFNSEALKRNSDIRRKAMSVNLSSNELVLPKQQKYNTSGFQFGKKSILKSKQTCQINEPKIQTNGYHQNYEENQYRPSCSSFVQNYSLNRSSSNLLNNLNSRSLMSTNGFLNTSLNNSKSQFKSTVDGSKSYAKIITKLQCKGCKIQYRPNQYYSHIEECREYLKMKLIQQKVLIQEQLRNL